MHGTEQGYRSVKQPTKCAQNDNLTKGSFFSQRFQDVVPSPFYTINASYVGYKDITYLTSSFDLANLGRPDDSKWSL